MPSTKVLKSGEGTRDASRRKLLVLGGVAATALLVRPDAAKAAAPIGDKKHESRTGRSITVDARPGPHTLDTAQTAVLVVDMQNDFGAKGGMFDRAGIDISGIRKAIAPTASVISAARQARIPIVYLKMAFHADLSDLGAADSVNSVRHLQIMHVGKEVPAPDGRASRILIRDTWNSDILPELTPQSADLVVYKSRFSGFYRTDLDERLRAMRVKHLVVTGCTTSICVESTVRDAMFRDYQCVLLSDCMSEPIGSNLARTNHDASLLTVQTLLGWVSDSASFLKALA
jgi:ureidoacrylate peracid hydrolase